jgi:hypothetical protein
VVLLAIQVKKVLLETQEIQVAVVKVVKVARVAHKVTLETKAQLVIQVHQETQGPMV